jgi:4-hydroxy-tetrahydrodipicolinate reductase
VLGLPRKIRVKVEGDPARFFRKTRADVAVLTTSSSIRTVKAQVLSLVQRGMNVVTTCEEMAFPTPAIRASSRTSTARPRPEGAGPVHRREPGFAMDALVLALTAPCARVDQRGRDPGGGRGHARLPLQRKVGAGLNLAQFRRAMTEGTVRHVGCWSPCT